MKYEKLSARLAALLDEISVAGIGQVMAAARSTPLAGASAGAPPSVRLFMRCREDATFDHLPGVHVHQPKGRVRTVEAPLDRVSALSEQGTVERLSPAVFLRPLLDVAAPAVQVPAFRAAQSLSGKNVVVGVVDSGIDSNHGAFAGRIHSIWDQNISGTGWGATNYGTVLSGATLGVSADTNGHGTHVAGIAAGSHPTFNGIAPEATLVVVKTDFTNTAIGDGVRYVFHVAQQLGLPAVVNLSLGGHWDAHDGSDDLATLIDAESGAGRIVVAAAGNEGNDPIHAQVTAPAGATVDVPLQIAPNSLGQSPPWAVLNGWYGGNAQLEVAVRASNGSTTPFQAVISGGSPTTLHNFSTARIRLTTPPATTTPNGDHQFLAELLPGIFGAMVQGGTWRLRIRNNGANPALVDVWSIVPQGSADAAFATPARHDAQKIGSPGSAAEAITVASYTTRNQWIDSSGAARGVGLALNNISDFSSPGPLRGGAQKPDVAAPGAMIVSALSSGSNPAASNVVAAGFRVNAGTSMAAPLISGIVALLLERDGTLTPGGVKALLQANSHIPGQAAGTFDNQWGFGLIDAAGL